MYKKKPFFIVFEGIEGCGKSFQSKKLYKNLKINLKDSVSPVLIEDNSDKNSYYVIMPMKI